MCKARGHCHFCKGPQETLVPISVVFFCKNFMQKLLPWPSITDFSSAKDISVWIVAIGEAHAALLAIQSATSCGVCSLTLEGDAFNVILVIQKLHLFVD
jgi:hypothetical protein